LALAQTRIVARLLAGVLPSVEVEIVPMATRGDSTGGPLWQAGGKGLFTARLEEALRDGEIDLAVHSAKDVPIDLPEGLAIAAVPERADPADVLVCPGGSSIEGLPADSRVGTSSLRRMAQLLARRGDLRVVPIRGNVETRAAKALSAGPEGVDATILAAAGLQRIGLAQRHADHLHRLDPDRFIPAAGQGALLVQAVADGEAGRIAAAVNDRQAFDALASERGVLAALGVDCHSCIAVLIRPAGKAWRGSAMTAESDGTRMVAASAEGESAADVGEALVARLRGG
jgi:hydroxymethylbilane synthase